MIDVHARYIRSLAAKGSSIAISSPCPPTPARRATAAGLGLTTPEFAVLLAYTKLTNTTRCSNRACPTTPRSRASCTPTSVTGSDQYARYVSAHRLRREIIATAS